MADPDITLLNRFWSKVDRRGDDECWPWTASKNKKGFGQFKVGGKRGKAVAAHRFCFELSVGPIPKGFEVRHTCKVHDCCNPAHLFTASASITPEEIAAQQAAKDAKKAERAAERARKRAAGSAANRIADKTTYIYGLIDPRTNQLRYVGKTVLTPDRRVFTHKWRARVHPHKRHSMAWLLSLEKDGVEPDVFTIEEVPIGGDWVEAEQFWIAYFRFIGADLCNHTDGGEGQPGHKQSPETIKKRIRRGAEHHRFGKPQHPNATAALKVGIKKFWQDPEAAARRNEKARSTLSAPEHVERLKRQTAKLFSDPLRKSAIFEKVAAATRTPEARARVSAESSVRWATMRGAIIAAQNEGKGQAWRDTHRALGKARMADPEFMARHLATRQRKIKDEDVIKIRQRLANGERVGALAIEYGVSQSMISHIKSGNRRR